MRDDDKTAEPPEQPVDISSYKVRQSDYTTRIKNVKKSTETNLHEDKKKRMISKDEKTRSCEMTQVERLIYDQSRAITILMQDSKNKLRLANLEKFIDLESKVDELRNQEFTRKTRRAFSDLHAEIIVNLTLDKILDQGTTDTNFIKMANDILNRSGYSQGLVEAEMLAPSEDNTDLADMDLRHLQTVAEDLISPVSSPKDKKKK